jgi:clusterin-associated protein 1
MSYRELRNFAEMMRALGYQRLVSVENFRSPNFPLVASTLYWMVQRYDPDIVMSDNIETEEARVHFLTKTAEALLNKANIKLNTKNLYMADGHAVRELLKVAKTLYAANEAQEAYKAGEELPDVPSLGTKSKDIRVARQLAADITDRGARLHDLLGHENDVKQDRQAALRFLDTISSNLDGGEHAHVRRSVDALVERCKEDIESAKKACDEYAADERALDAKIKKKKNELERHEKRLSSLQNVRPAFMDEYEKLEGELQKQYSVYLERFRNLDYLQAELQTYHAADKAEVDEHDRTLKRMQKRLREEELRILRGEQEPVGGEASKKMMDDQPRPTQARPSQRSQRPRDLDSSEDIDSDEISRDSDSDSVSLAASSGAGSGIDELDDDDSGDSLSDDGASSRDFSGSASDDF